MFELIIALFFLLIGFYLLIKAADFFVSESALLGKNLGISELVIGLTIVAIGTSIPEIFTGLASILFTPNYPDFVVGTILGSNTANILLVLGFTLFFGSIRMPKKDLKNISILALTSLAFVISVLIGYMSLALSLLVPVYIYYLFSIKSSEKIKQELSEELKETPNKSITRSFFILLFSLAVLFISSKLIIFSIEAIGQFFLIPLAYLTLTIISFATSLPELAVSLSTVKYKKQNILIGNLLGTNIANICIIIGFSGFFGGYAITPALYIIPSVFFIISLILFIYILTSKKANHKLSYLLLGLYLIYIISFFIF